MGIKTTKRILLSNGDSLIGKLDNDKAIRAHMTHRKTPCQQTGISLAAVRFGRPNWDHLSICDLKLRLEWQEIAKKTEKALARDT